MPPDRFRSSGIGGAGIVGRGIAADTATVTNYGSISGIGGGASIGIQTFDPSNVTNYGTITRTTFAILFEGNGASTLTLGPTLIIKGGVVALGPNNTFQLGGTGDGSFDLSTIGHQYLSSPLSDYKLARV
jgi:hypothetical protein